ncbi:MAG: activase [Elusimicrobia bacterium RIFOXYB2_FULL_49_7]|nr:MAG: activase [Elusimicrobia bacterium RIFOXYB2_FULL_49_7]
MKACGINIGSSSVKIVVLEGENIVFQACRAHEGDVKQVLFALLEEAKVIPGTRTLVTGNEGRKSLRLKSIIEALAIQEALKERKDEIQALASMGGEDLVVYLVGHEGQIINSFSGNKCASGTGEFFKQQLKRMDFGLEQGIQAATGAAVHRISSRCSVFMKSDCTHKLNKGEATKGDIVLSLSAIMADKVVEFLKKAKMASGKVLLSGGLTRNHHLVNFVKEKMPTITFDIPDIASVFEAYGAALLARTEGEALPELAHLFRTEHVSYEKMAPLLPFRDKVDYKQPRHGKVRKGGEYILGIDGGSTTTKVALIDAEKEEIVASFYGRTHGDPIQALKECLKEIRKEIIDEIGDLDIKITLAAATGSSREILGVFMETPGIYNEIIAHTVGTTYFDSGIDTLFEIGGQDAKYVYLKNGVPIDYAMNEACSAGTGSFLEESAKGDLSIESASEIGGIAMQANAPLKFGEHCSAFINSDIRKAIQEGASKYNIVAGLAYSVVLNYLNRVVGNRTIGNRIVIQGGVAKNSAIPLAFAALLNKPVIIPPDPELMGCFGVGILAKRKCAEGLLFKNSYDIDEVVQRQISYEGEFVCKSCDNYCPIRRLKVNQTVYFFGGRCNKYANSRKKIKIDEASVEDLVQRRHDLLFTTFAYDFAEGNPSQKMTVGVPQVFSIYSLWPLYSHFFGELGVDVFLSDSPLLEGYERMHAPFCFPGEIAHGMMEAVQRKGCDYYFLPHFKDMESWQEDTHACLCPIVQGLPYYLRTAFDLPDEKILKPILSFRDGIDKAGKPFEEMAEQLGFTREAGRRAFKKGVEMQRAYLAEAREMGRKAIEKAEAEKRTSVVLFGRPYNAFTKHTNMGIPRKFTSRGYSVIPFDFMPFENADIYENMYWYFGQQNMRAAVNIAKSRHLYLCYISNFSCAPDSFILHYLRWINGTKPFLILELDSHAADAGIDTRIEAFLDIIEGYAKSGLLQTGTEFNRRYEVELGRKVRVLDQKTGEKIDLRDRRVKLLFPNMGNETTEAMAAISCRYGIDTEALPVSDRDSVQLARDVASGKECIPCLLVLGAFIKYFQVHGVDPNRIYILFMPITTGPCRTGQYAVFYDRILREGGYENIALLRLNSDNSYTELGSDFSKLAWHAICTGDAIKDLRSGIRVCLKEPADGFKILEESWKEMLAVFSKGNLARELPPVIRKMALKLKALPKQRPVKDIRKVLVVGEIFVRRDEYSVSTLVDHLTEWGILVKISGLSEWIHYLDYMRKFNLKNEFAKKPLWRRTLSNYGLKLGLLNAEFAWKHRVQHRIDDMFALSEIFPVGPSDMRSIMRRAHEFASEHFETEATLSPAVAAEAMESGFSGIAIISPFACLPGRLIEAVYKPWAMARNFPVIALENDGNVYPPNIISKINIFSLNVSSFTPKTGK